MSDRNRTAVLAVLGGHIAFGVGVILAPRRLGSRWLGPAAATAPSQVPLRALGAREIILHTAAIIAVLNGQPARPWLAGSAGGDVADIAATFAGRRQLPDGSLAFTAVVGGASALASAAVAAAIDA
jgi:hypothetical protein